MRPNGKSFALLPFILCAALAHASTARPLADALRELQRHGVNVVFSSQVVTPAMRVEREPASRSPRARLDELLAPHNLTVVEGPGDVLIVVARPPSVSRPNEAAPAALPVMSEKIVVQPSRITLLLEEPFAPVTLARDEIAVMPHLGDDIFRTLSVLPGTTANDVSAEVHVRGARRDELLVRLDGQELYEPYHLKDFDNVLSIVGATNLAAVDLITAALPVSYGDRMAGVLDMVTVKPSEERTFRLAANIHGAQIDASDGFQQGKGTWLASFRRGSTDYLGRALAVESPRFWDFFGKVGTEISPQQSVQLHGLTSNDRLLHRDVEEKRLDTEYGSSYVWMTHQALAGPRALAQTSVSGARLHRDRQGSEEDDEREFGVRDERSTSVLGLRHAWIASTGRRSSIEIGGHLQRFETRVDYDSFREFDTPLVAIRAEPREGPYSFHDRVTSDHLGLYASNRLRLRDDVTLEAGMRYDRQSLSEDSLLSPRVNLAWRFGASSVLRVAWGRFSQSQRSYELMVEDADVNVYPSERSQHAVVAVEHGFESTPLTSLRLEAYRRLVSNPRPRYESLYKPFDAFPEGEVDRARIAPERSMAEGVELLVEGRPRGRVAWWLNYALARTTDRIDGRDVPRRFDQTHALKIDVNYRFAPSWNLNAAWLGHTGWPATPLFLEDGEPVLGPRNSRRLRDYHRIDMRLSREWLRSNGSLAAYVDAHNVLGRRNVSGLDATIDEETGELVIDTETFPRFFASAGVVWTFGVR